MTPIRYIYSFLLAGIFLISSAGIHYTKHTCLKTDNVFIVLSQEEYACCNTANGTFCEETETCCEPEETCCGLNHERESTEKVGTHENCCRNDSKYLKTEDDYITPEKARLPGIETHFNIAWFSVPEFPHSSTAVQEYAHSPPELYSSRARLIQHGVLLI